MKPYLDGAFLLSCLVPNADSPTVSSLLHQFSGPIFLNGLHRLQAENFVMRLSRSPDAVQKSSGEVALRAWRYLHDEGIFAFVSAPWEPSYEQAAEWNALHPGLPPQPFVLLHAALAFQTESSHFLSFTPSARAVAKRAGLKLLPMML